MISVAAELEKARKNLLDLTMRNRLLNYRYSKVRSIRIVGELPSEIYDALVLRGKTLEVRGTGPKTPQNTDEPSLNSDHGAASESMRAEEWHARTDDELEAQHTDRYLQTPYDDESLSEKLFRVYHEGRSAVEEQGYTVVHLAVGFLEWFESDDSDQPRRAPLILIPVELERVRAGDFSKVKWTEEDVFANISLAAKLVEHGVALPSFDAPEEKSGIDSWLQSVVDAIAKKRCWRVLSEMAVDFFSFTKFVMWKDLDPATWPAEKKLDDHPLLHSVFTPDGLPAGDGFDEREIDTKLTARDLWHVMDADPSQIAVIEDAKAAANLVVQGPPGTGKSQTITNLIAEALAANKTVLFVSEKMAALEVVKTRLDNAGLGPFCLELHSRKSNKKSVLLELQRSLSSMPAGGADEQAFDEHELLKKELDQYAFALGAAVGALGRTPYELFGMRQSALAQLEQRSRAAVPRPRIERVENITLGDAATAENAIRDLAYAIPLVRPVATHPWRHSTVKSLAPDRESELHDELARTADAVRTLIDLGRDLETVSGVQPPVSLAAVEAVSRAAEIVARAPGQIESHILQNVDWNGPNRDADEILRRLDVTRRKREDLSHKFTADALESNTKNDLDVFAPLATRVLRFFDSAYRALRKRLATLYVSAVPKTAEMLLDLRGLVSYQELRDQLRHDKQAAGLFGRRWTADRSEPRELKAFADWVVAFRRELVSNVLTSRSIELAASKVDADAVRASVHRVRDTALTVSDSVARVLEDIGIDAVVEFGQPLLNVTLVELESQLRRWAAKTAELFRWSRFNAARTVARQTIAAAIESAVLADQIDEIDVLPFFHLAVAESLLRVAFNEREALGSFVGDLHERKIARFRELDSNLTALNRARLSRKLHAQRPMISGGASRGSEVGILIGEFNRKRGHMPIRKLLSACGGLIQRIKPCFLMSPLSIAQFLDPRIAKFDLIVFDEASQVRPEDAVGALLRGKQLVVMGDTQQLPPTSFFDHITSDHSDDADDDTDAPQDASISDVESILHQCARSFASKTLNWHYRSRHESLIAVSNLHFYDNRLRIYPSAIDWADELGLHLVHVPESTYDRGKSSTNRVEAQVVAAAAVDHYRRFPNKSLGVGTFNIKQQQSIQEEIEIQLRLHPDMEPFFKSDRNEHFFVKNLETIQGDERDVIFISVGYGRDATGKLTLNFGPLNQDGGERRLNVLISRAREKCVVYSNFRANDLPIQSTTSKGVFALKTFLEYAETRRLIVEDRPDNDADSPFEEAVAATLRELGYEVRKQVGCAGFRVDIAIVDPEYRGRYLIGIECDGANYHSSPVARDRDRLRQQILENLGWTIHRVWSTDWYRNRAETVSRLLGAVDNAKSSPRRMITSVAPEQPSYTSAWTANEYEEEAVVHDFTETENASEGPRISISTRVLTGVSNIGINNSQIVRVDIPQYETCRSLRIPIVGELHLVAPALLALAIEDVVRVEGPVHIDEVIRRIRTLWLLQRSGNRIREAIERGVRIAVARRTVETDGHYLRIPNSTTRVRRRSGDPPARIDFICDEEVAEAIKHVLRVQFATEKKDLVDAVARCFGIQATTEATAHRIATVIDRHVGGDLVSNGDRIEIAHA